MIARTETDVAEGHLSSRLHHQRAALLPGIPRRLALPEAVQLRPSPAHERERIEERQRHGPFHAGEVVRLARRIRQDRDRGWEPDVLCPRLRHGRPAVPNHGELSARLRELFRVELRRIRPLARFHPEYVPALAFLHRRLRNRASLALREYGGGELRSLPDAGDVAAHRVERLRLRRLRSGEGAEVELPGLGLLHRIQFLEVLAGAKLREG